jgi:hypothetical protein
MLELNSIITNGYVDISTMEVMLNDGWTFVCAVPAKTAHPHALDTDILSIFSKYTEPDIDESNQATAK